MRSLLVLLVMLGALLAGGWIGGETLLARGVRNAIASDQRLTAGRIHELREPDRIGVRVAEPKFDDPAADLKTAGDWVDIWVAPTAPNELHLSAAPGTSLTAQGQSIALGAGGLEAEMRFSPTHNLAVSDAALHSDGATLAGAPLIGPIALNAELAGFGADSPPGTGAAYDVRGSISDLSLGPVTAGRLPDAATVKGTGRVWLSGVPMTAGAVAEGRRRESQPHLVGLRGDGIDLTLGDLSARLYARLVADEAGLAKGEIVIDTADSERFVARAVDLGLIPRNAALLANAALKSLGTPAPAAAPVAAPAPSGAVVDAPRAGVSEIERAANSQQRLIPDAGWPAPRNGETRITIAARDGKLWLGPLPLGPAPRLSAPTATKAAPTAPGAKPAG
ncbi:DUF2125 domain-containing protein [Paracoccus suum]|nr:DUF2125 domain-containing protein [Paracoccus suum]